MASVLRGTGDAAVNSILAAIQDYERQFPGATGVVYRQNPGAIRVRIIDSRFAGMSRARRHDDVWDLLCSRVGEDTMGEVSSLILLAPAEVESSLANMDFEDPVPSQF